MTTLLDLKKICEAATPGPWEPTSSWNSYAVAAEKFDVVCTVSRKYRAPVPLGQDLGCREEDARHIATFNPATVLELLALVEEGRWLVETLHNMLASVGHGYQSETQAYLSRFAKFNEPEGKT